MDCDGYFVLMDDMWWLCDCLCDICDGLCDICDGYMFTDMLLWLRYEEISWNIISNIITFPIGVNNAAHDEAAYVYDVCIFKKIMCWIYGNDLPTKKVYSHHMFPFDDYWLHLCFSMCWCTQNLMIPDSNKSFCCSDEIQRPTSTSFLHEVTITMCWSIWIVRIHLHWTNDASQSSSVNLL